MSRLSWLQKIYWTHFAKPVEDRALFRQLIRHPVGSILEIGMGDGQRMRRLAKLWRGTSTSACMRYIATDEFEAAQDGGRHMRLKQAYQLASQLGLKASLVPGDAASAIPRVAHKMGATDLIIADGHLDPHRPFGGIVGNWLHHLAHDSTIILACAESGGTLQLVDIRSTEKIARHAA